MNLTARRSNRFSAPAVLHNDTPVLGATAQEWDQVFTGNMDKTLAEVKKLAMGSSPKRDVSKATSFDLASFAGKRLHHAK
ncbi:MAG: hypothetical protein ABJA84_08230 [Polaromonas sp.]